MSTAIGGGGKGGTIEPESGAPVEFTLAELWFLHDLVRHDEEAINEDKWPVVSTGLNGQVALAIVACEDGGLKSYALALDEGHLLLLDYHVRRDMKTPEGASGAEILLKVFRARRDLAYGPIADGGIDISYKEAVNAKTREAAAEAAEAKELKEFSEKEAENADTDEDADQGADQGAARGPGRIPGA